MAITKVQTKSGTTSSSSSLAITLDSAPTAGSLLVLFVLNNEDAPVDGVSSASGAWTLLSTNSAAVYAELYYLQNAAAADNAVTVAFAVAPANMAGTVMEFSGVATSSSADANSNNGSTYDLADPSISIGAGVQTDEVYIAMFNSATTTGSWNAPSNGWTENAEVDAAPAFSFVTEYKIVSSIAAQSTGTAQNPPLVSGPWGAIGASFKAATAVSIQNQFGLLGVG